MTDQLYLTLGGGIQDPVEVGPFTEAKFADSALYVNGNSTSCATYGSGVWTVTNGTHLGNPDLTNDTYGIILGQAK